MSGPFAVVTGVPRSGTTLVRNILAAHPDAVAPPEAQFVGAALGRLLATSHAGDLPAALALLRDEPGFDRWALPADRLDARLAVAPPNSFAELVRALYDVYGDVAGGRPFDKTTGTGSWLPLAAALFPDAPVVVIVRDPRTVAMSLALQPWHRGGLAAAAHAWRRGVAADLAAVEAHPDRHLLVRYEDLVADPDLTIERVAAFVGLDDVVAMHEWWVHPGGDAASGERTTQRASGPIQPTSRDTGDLLPSELAVIEAAAGPLLDRLGYASLVPGRARRVRRVAAQAALATSALRARLDGAVADRAPGGRPATPVVTGPVAAEVVAPARLIPVGGDA